MADIRSMSIFLYLLFYYAERERCIYHGIYHRRLINLDFVLMINAQRSSLYSSKLLKLKYLKSRKSLTYLLAEC